MDKRVKIQGFNVDLMSFDEVIKALICAVNDAKNIHVVTINPEIIQNAKKTPELKKIINEAELVTPDGVGVKLALKMKGINQEQVTGVDLSKKMLEIAGCEQFRVALVGAKQDVLDLAVENIKKMHDGINIVYTHNGYFDDFNPIIKDILNSKAQFLLCAMGSPRQEMFISELKKQANGIVMIGVGGTFDVLSGKVQLAPDIYRKLGLEWLYRTIKQPERFKRIFPTLPIFFFQSIIDSVFNRNNS